MSELFDSLVSLDASLAGCTASESVLSTMLQHLPTLLPCDGCALAQIDDATLLPVISTTSPSGQSGRFGRLLATAIDKGLFALALRRGQGVIDELPDRQVLLLQACATPTHLAGLLLAVCPAEAAQADLLSAIALAATRCGAAHENLVLSRRILAHAHGLEQAVEERTRDLASARDRAEAASRAKSSFLATVSHELRTPLNGIIGMTELIHGDEPDPLRRDRLAVVHSCAEDLLRQIDGILDLSRIEAGRVDLRPTEADPSAVVMHILRTLAPRAEAKDIELAWLPAPGFPARAVIDAGRLRQVLMNLVGNALKFTDRGSILVRGTAEACDGACRLTFDVVDTGLGIANEAQDKLFTPFIQADESINRRFGGSGLGLSISRGLCQAMGGDLTLNSVPDQGSTFTAIVTAHSAQPVKNQPNGQAHVDVSGPCGESVRLGLARIGVSVSPTRPGDILILDGDEPGCADRLVDLPIDHPIIVLTSLSRPPCIAAALAKRRQRLVSKPPDPEELAAAMRELRSGKHQTTRIDRGSAALSGLQGRRVLYADDQHVNRLVVSGQLQRLAIATTLATGGAEAVSLALSGSWDAILLDCQMPEVDGFTAAARIRAGGCRTPLIAVTAHAMAGDREECLQRGFDDYLAKPVRPTELAATLTRWFTLESEPPVNQPPSRLDSLRAEVGSDVLRDVLLAMLGEGPTLVAEAVAACGRGDLATAGKRAHALKGDAGNLGLDLLADVARALEQTARLGDQAGATAAAQRLPGLWERAAADLRLALDSPGA